MRCLNMSPLESCLIVPSHAPYFFLHDGIFKKLISKGDIQHLPTRWSIKMLHTKPSHFSASCWPREKWGCTLTLAITVCFPLSLCLSPDFKRLHYFLLISDSVFPVSPLLHSWSLSLLFLIPSSAHLLSKCFFTSHAVFFFHFLFRSSSWVSSLCLCFFLFFSARMRPGRESGVARRWEQKETVGRDWLSATSSALCLTFFLTCNLETKSYVPRLPPRDGVRVKLGNEYEKGLKRTRAL